ncbi:MAG TPA: hypothetical protein VJ872_15190 [Nocardioides sp.]|nr:hypothetical protein [Nocardioides sp.]
MSEHPDPIRLVLELDPGAEPPRGRVRGDAGWVGFTGWTELGQRIARLAAPEQHDNREERP